MWVGGGVYFKGRGREEREVVRGDIMASANAIIDKSRGNGKSRHNGKSSLGTSVSRNYPRNTIKKKRVVVCSSATLHLGESRLKGVWPLAKTVRACLISGIKNTYARKKNPSDRLSFLNST